MHRWALACILLAGLAAGCNNQSTPTPTPPPTPAPTPTPSTPNAPAITKVTPRVATAGREVVVQGINLVGDLRVFVGGTEVPVRNANGTSLAFTLPNLAPGDYDVQITNAAGQSATAPGPSVLLPGDEGIVPRAALVVLDGARTAAEIQQVAAQNGFRLVRYVPALVPGSNGPCGDVLALFEDVQAGRATAEAINALDGANAVLTADPVAAWSNDAYPTDEPVATFRWGLDATNAEKSYDFFSSKTNLSGVKLAVLDTGVQDHPEFVVQRRSTLLPGKNFTGKDENPSNAVALADDVTDVALFPRVGGIQAGHGTGVAAIAAAPVPNAIPNAPGGFGTMAGVAPGASILPVKVCDLNGDCNGFNVAAGVCYAVSQNAQVLNLSLGGPAPSRILRDTLREAARTATIVAAAGNEGRTRPHYPAAYSTEVDGLIAVGSVGRAPGAGGTSPDALVPSTFSNRGAWVNLVAPGEAIMTAGWVGTTTPTPTPTPSPSPVGRASDAPPPLPPRADAAPAATVAEAEAEAPALRPLATTFSLGYRTFTGTSFAAPYVAGAAALLRAQHPEWTPAQVKARLLATATAVPACSAVACGQGLLNVGAAVGAP